MADWSRWFPEAQIADKLIFTKDETNIRSLEERRQYKKYSEEAKVMDKKLREAFNRIYAKLEEEGL